MTSETSGVDVYEFYMTTLFGIIGIEAAQHLTVEHPRVAQRFRSFITSYNVLLTEFSMAGDEIVENTVISKLLALVEAVRYYCLAVEDVSETSNVGVIADDCYKAFRGSYCTFAEAVYADRRFRCG